MTNSTLVDDIVPCGGQSSNANTTIA